MRSFLRSILACAVLAGLSPAFAAGPSKSLILATTTSTQDTGLLDVLVPMFQQKTGIAVKTIAVGSGQAMAMGERGEADVLLVHSPDAEKKFMASGFGVKRQLVMHNDFVILGPASDPAGVKGAKTATDAFKHIAEKNAPFYSRADNSGTHAMEQKLWKAAGLSPVGQKWYFQTGLGMGQTLNVTAEKKGYTLSDRGTYLAMNKVLGMAIVCEGDRSLLNIYHVIQLDPNKYPKVNHQGAAEFAQFLLSKEGQDTVRTFGVAKFGSPLFFPDGGKPEE